MLDEFKLDLKMALIRLDEQLRDKVDKVNFEEYGKKVENKITNEFSKKIDKTDLKKNTNVINKKVLIPYLFL